MAKRHTKIIIGIHTILIVLLYTAPLWLSWKLIALVIVLNYIQILIFGGCILTIQQFDSAEMSFQEWLWSHFGFTINRLKFNRFIKWYLPFIILGIAFVFQAVFGLRSFF